MKFKVSFAAIALCFAVSSQSYGFDLLDRMLGGSGCGCDTSCCATPEPTCGCDGIGMIRGRFFNRGCDTGCDTGCAAKPACNQGCDSGCDNGCGLNRCCRPKILSLNVKCLSIPVIVPKICLPKIRLPKPCLRSCCNSGCDNGCASGGCASGGCNKAEPSCGADNACCKPVISVKLNRCGLLDRMKCRPKLFNKCGCDSSCGAKATCGCEPACGSDYAKPENKVAPKPEAKEMTSNGPVPPAPVVDPAAFGDIQATPISDVN